MPKRKRIRFYKKILLVFCMLLFILLIFNYKNIWKGLRLGIRVLTGSNNSLTQSNDGKINILILGVGGAVHDGPDLTDTIIFTSIDPKNNKILLASIPRDLWAKELKAKINTAYSDGEAKQQGGGILQSKAMLEMVTGKQIDYVVKVDFDGFVKAIDIVGGLDVTVENTLDDYSYPIAGREDDTCGEVKNETASTSAEPTKYNMTDQEIYPCRYEHLHFDKGQTHMNGAMALKFVRSRHANGVEGSDFARSKRQEKVIKALKDKLFSLNMFINPTKLINMFNIVKVNISTNIKEENYLDFIRLAEKMRSAKMINANIDIGSANNHNGLLINPPISEEFNNQWVLIPRAGNGNYTEIQHQINCGLSETNCKINNKTQ